MIKLTRFTAPWCAPCRMLAPVLMELEKEHPEVEFQTVDIDKNPEAGEAYQIRSVPTVVFLKNETHVKTLVGAHPKKTYQEALGEI